MPMELSNSTGYGNWAIQGNGSERLIRQVSWAIDLLIARHDLNLRSMVESNICEYQFGVFHSSPVQEAVNCDVLSLTELA
jgi:hypothetical protein